VRAADEYEIRTCIVTNRSSTVTFFVELGSDLVSVNLGQDAEGRGTNDSSPMVAVHMSNLPFTYWFMSDDFPTLSSGHQSLDEYEEQKGSKLTCRCLK